MAYCFEYSYTKIDVVIGWRMAEKAIDEFGWAFNPRAACTIKVNEKRLGVCLNINVMKIRLLLAFSNT